MGLMTKISVVNMSPSFLFLLFASLLECTYLGPYVKSPLMPETAERVLPMTNRGISTLF